MGWGKKFKKAIRKVSKPVEKAVKQVGKAAEDVGKGAVGLVAGAAGLGKEPDVKVVEQAAPVQAPAPVAAQVIEPPSKEDVDTDDDSQTESGKKKTRAGGKKSLSVARSSGRSSMHHTQP